MSLRWKEPRVYGGAALVAGGLKIGPDSTSMWRPSTWRPVGTSVPYVANSAPIKNHSKITNLSITVT